MGKLKYCLSGGIIGLIAGLIFFRLFQFFESKVYYYTFGLPFTLGEKIFFSFGLRDEMLAYIEIIFGLMLYLLLGVIVVLFFQRYKKKKM